MLSAQTEILMQQVEVNKINESDENDSDFKDSTDDEEEELEEEIPQDEVADIAIEAITLNSSNLRNGKELYRDSINDLELNSDEEDLDYEFIEEQDVFRTNQSEIEDEEQIDEDEVQANIAFSNLPIDKDSILKKNEKILRNGSKIPGSQEFDNLAERIDYLMALEK